MQSARATFAPACCRRPTTPRHTSSSANMSMCACGPPNRASTRTVWALRSSWKKPPPRALRGPTRAVMPPTPACGAMRVVGRWNTAWDPFYDLDPAWTDAFFATGIGIYKSGVMSAKDVELLSIAFDACCTHMYAPGTRPSHPG